MGGRGRSESGEWGGAGNLVSFGTFLGPLELSKGLLGSPGLSWGLLGSPGFSWALLGPPGLSWALLRSPRLACVYFSSSGNIV